METHSTNAHVVARIAHIVGAENVFSDSAKSLLAAAGIERVDYYEAQDAQRLRRYNERLTAIALLDVPEPVRAFMVADTARREAVTPEPRDLRNVARRALTLESQFGKARPAWVAKGDCRVHFSRAWSLSHEQQSYADVARDLVLFSGTATEESQARLGEFLRRADSHTGWAGSGCNWTLEHVGDGFVVISCRASIAD